MERMSGMKKLLLGIACAGLVIAVLGGCSSGTTKETGPVYLPVSFTVANGNTITEGTLGYDAFGNMTEFKRVQSDTVGGTSFGFDGSVSRYEAGDANTSEYTLQWDSNGLPISATFDNKRRDGSQKSGSLSIEAEKDSAGRIAKIEKSDSDGAAAYVYEYSYDKDGFVSKFSQTYVPKNNTVETDYEPDGWESGESYETDSEGRVVGVSSMYGKLTFVYDENDCIVGINKKDELFASIEYVEIEDPSDFARACAHNKISFDLIHFGQPDLSLSPIY